jgi:hypothetical protein
MLKRGGIVFAEFESGTLVLEGCGPYGEIQSQP